MQMGIQINKSYNPFFKTDSPFHFMANGTSIDMMPLDTAIGLAMVIEINNPVSINRVMQGHAAPLSDP
jgi:kynurenine formamidase